jgi:hypothetical protein
MLEIKRLSVAVESSGGKTTPLMAVMGFAKRGVTFPARDAGRSPGLTSHAKCIEGHVPTQRRSNTRGLK